MERRALYLPGHRLEIEKTAPLDRDEAGCGKDCRRCTLHAKARSVCVPAEFSGTGRGDVLLIVGEAPSKSEDQVGRPFVGVAGDVLRKLVEKNWPGDVVYANALGCFPGRTKLTDKMVNACRGYLAGVFAEVDPSRVLLFGSAAARSVLGRAVPSRVNRRAYSFTSEGVAVISCIHPAIALRNRFLRGWFESDTEWALTVDDEDIGPFVYDAHYLDVQTPVDAVAAVGALQKGRVSFDIEATGQMWESSYKVISVSLCDRDSLTPFVWGRAALEDPDVRQPLLDYLADDRFDKGGQSVKYDIQGILHAYGVMPKGVVFDTRFARKILSPEAGAKLDQMAELVGMGGTKEEASEARKAVTTVISKGLRAIGKLEKRKQDPSVKLTKVDRKALLEFDDLEDMDPELVSFARENPSEHNKWDFGLIDRGMLERYNARDALTTALLDRRLGGEIHARPNIKRVYDQIVRKAAVAASRVEAWGIAVDKESLLAFDAYLEHHENAELAKLNAYVPAGFKWGSPDQVAELLFDKLKLPAGRTTATGKRSTDKKVLESLQGKHDLIDSLIEYRRLDKLRGTYAKGMIPHVRSDGRIHGSLNPDGARTGRTSYNDPNLQNIPKPITVEGKMARDIFVAPPGYILLQYDYSQIELRIAAMLSGDPKMLEIYASGDDYHLRTAQLICPLVWSKETSPEQIAEEYHRTGKSKHRSAAKNVNFALLYGEGDDSLAKQIGCKKVEARRIREAILGTFHVFAQWCKDMVLYARKHGGVWTWWDGGPARFRPLIDVADHDDYKRSEAERACVNTPPQGTASDFLIASLIASIDWIDSDKVNAKLVLPVHDSIMFEVHESAVEAVKTEVPRIMTGWNSGGVPLVVDGESGPAFGSLQPLVCTA